VCIVGTQRTLEDGSLVMAMRSVVDPLLPEVPDRVRANAALTGWKLTPRDNGTQITCVRQAARGAAPLPCGADGLPCSLPSRTVLGARTRYIAQTNPNGWTPKSVLNLVAASVPLCAATVRNYLEQHGPPPMLRHTAGVLKAFTFTPAEHRYVATWQWTADAAHPATLFLLSRKRFPGGATLSFTPPNVFDVAWLDSKVPPRDRHGACREFRASVLTNPPCTYGFWCAPSRTMSSLCIARMRPSWLPASATSA